MNTPEYLFCPTASLTKENLEFQTSFHKIFLQPWEVFLVNSFHMYSQIASLYASVVTIGAFKWLFFGVCQLIVF